MLEKIRSQISELEARMAVCERLIANNARDIANTESQIKKSLEKIAFSDAKVQSVSDRIEKMADKFDVLSEKIEKKIVYDQATADITEKTIKKYVTLVGIFFSVVAVAAGHLDDIIAFIKLTTGDLQ